MMGNDIIRLLYNDPAFIAKAISIWDMEEVKFQKFIRN